MIRPVARRFHVMILKSRTEMEALQCSHLAMKVESLFIKAYLASAFYNYMSVHSSDLVVNCCTKIYL